MTIWARTIGQPDATQRSHDMQLPTTTVCQPTGIKSSHARGLNMDYENWKRLTPRQKAKWPAVNKGYLRPQKQVTISIDADLAEWLIENVVGRSSFTSDLEETIVTALEILRRDQSTEAAPASALLRPSHARPGANTTADKIP